MSQKIASDPTTSRLIKEPAGLEDEEKENDGLENSPNPSDPEI